MKLDRRNFMGGMIAAAATPLLTGAATARAAATASSDDQGAWAERGFIDAGGFHESYLFTVRRGGQRLDAKKISDYQQSEELIQKLHSDGVEVFHTHLYKGFGMAAELEQMEEARKTVEIVHRLGMKVDTYIQWNTMMYETFFAEEPRAVNWVQRDIAGLPILLSYGYQQSFRYRPCFANQEYLDYLKKVVRYAVVEVKTDFIHFDNFDLNSEPDSCHCPACVKGFRQRLKTKYTDEQRKERFGFVNTDFVNPPQWNKENPPQKMQIIFDPAIQEWIDFRCQVMSDALKQMYDLVRSLNKEVAIEINPAGITGQNRSWESGVDHARLLKYTRTFWSEEGNLPGYEADGRLITRARSYKLARAYNNVLFAYVENHALALGEALTFNHTLGYVGISPLSAVTKEYIDFSIKNRESYEGSEDVANIAVFRSYASLTYNHAAVQLCTILVEQILIQSSVPFDLVFDEGLNDLSKYKVLILPNTECLSDEQISLLHKFVERGGSLVVTGHAGMYDEWRRLRVTPGLQGLVDHQPAAKDYQETVETAAVVTGASSRKQVGRGKVAYLPVVEFDGPLPEPKPDFAITNHFWKRPKNWQEIVELVHWAADDQVSLSVEAPEGVLAHRTAQPEHRRTFVHLLNYNVAKVPTQHGVKVRIALPDNAKASKITLHTPGKAEPETINFSSEATRTSFTVPALEAYSLIAVQW